MAPKHLLLGVVVVLAVLGAASYGYAQTIVKCDIPFDFSLGGESYPAGEYTLTASGDRYMLVVRNSSDKVVRAMMVRAEDQAPGTGSLLKFNRYGVHYFLASVVVGNKGMSLNLPRGAAEHEFAARGVGETVTLIAASR